MRKFVTILGLALVSVGSASAASDDAWAEFATEVETACITATADLVSNASVVVDPFGSESYGLAIVTGYNAAGSSSSVICVFDKQTKAVQIGGELDVTVTPAQPAG